MFTKHKLIHLYVTYTKLPITLVPLTLVWIDKKKLTGDLAWYFIKKTLNNYRKNVNYVTYTQLSSKLVPLTAVWMDKINGVIRYKYT